MLSLSIASLALQMPHSDFHDLPFDDLVDNDKDPLCYKFCPTRMNSWGQAVRLGALVLLIWPAWGPRIPSAPTTVPRHRYSLVPAASMSLQDTLKGAPKTLQDPPGEPPERQWYIELL